MKTGQKRGKQQTDSPDGAALLQRWMTAHPDGQLPTTEELLAWMDEPMPGENVTEGGDAPFTEQGPVPQPTVSDYLREIERLEQMLGVALDGVKRAWYEGRDAAMNSENPGSLRSPYEMEDTIADLDS